MIQKNIWNQLQKQLAKQKKSIGDSEKTTVAFEKNLKTSHKSINVSANMHRTFKKSFRALKKQDNKNKIEPKKSYWLIT